MCDGCGSDVMSWLRESWLTIVSCPPRAMVIDCGQIALFWITSVAGLVLGVHEPDGPVLLFESSPPHEIAAASVSAAAVPPTRVLRFRISQDSSLYFAR